MGKRMTQRLSMFALLSLVLSSSTAAQAEMYVAGQVGATIPDRFSNIKGVGSEAGATFSDLSLHESVMYGAKLGYYFDSVKWLGLETEVFNTTPHVKQQTGTVSFGGASATDTFTGLNVRVLTWAPINLVVRYQAGQLEPYAGVGMGVFFARIKDGETGGSSSSTTVGLNTQVGLRYLVTQNVSLFGEWKYNRASFDFAEGGLRATIASIILSSASGTFSNKVLFL